MESLSEHFQHLKSWPPEVDFLIPYVLWCLAIEVRCPKLEIQPHFLYYL